MNSSTSVDRGRRGRWALARAVCCALLLPVVFSARAHRPLTLTRDGGHLYAEVLLQDSVAARAMLESGIAFPLIDSALVWSHPELFRPEKLDSVVRFRMAAGANYVAHYKLAPGLSVSGSRSLCDTYVVDMSGHKGDLLWPLNRFTTDRSGAPGIFGLDIARGRLEPFAEEELPDDGWASHPMTRDERSGMYCLRGSLALADDCGRSTAEEAELVVDLGNAMLLALFTYKPEVSRFVSRARIPQLEGRTPAGKRLPVLQPDGVTFLDTYTFRGRPVVLLENRMRLPGHGFLGLGFFERFRVIFDFRHSQLRIALPEAE